MRIYHAGYTKNGQQLKSKRWYLDFYHKGRRCRLPVLADKRSTESFASKIKELCDLRAARLTPGAELQLWIDGLPDKTLHKLVEWDIIDGSRAAAATTLPKHLLAYRDYLKHKGNTPEYYEKIFSRIESVINECKIGFFSDVSASRIQKFLSDSIDAGKMKRKTANHYISALKGFFAWLILEGRAFNNPIGHIVRFDTAKDDKRLRRALTAEQMRLLLVTTAKGRSYRGITGLERAIHYETAAMTGIRAAELRALRVRDFDFTANIVCLAGKHTKNRKDASIPLKPEFADRLKTFFAGKLPDCPAFKTPASSHEVRVLRADLKAAGIPEKDDSGRVFDFHSFRVFFASMLAAAGTNPKTAMELLRHSDIRLTMNVYSHAYRESLTTAVNTLPNLDFNKAESIKTGTDEIKTDTVELVNHKQKVESKSLCHSLPRESRFEQIKQDYIRQKDPLSSSPKTAFNEQKTGFCGEKHSLAKLSQDHGQSFRIPSPPVK